MAISPFALTRRYYRRNLRRLKGEERGAAAVEMAMLMVPFFTIFFAMIETGYMYLTAVIIEGATAEASRQVRTGAVQQSGAPITIFRQLLCTNIYGIIPCDELQVDVRNFAQFGGAGGPAMTGSGTGNAFSPGAAGDIIVVRVAYKVEFITPFLSEILSLGGGDGSRLLISSSAFRNEPFDGAGG